jgi:hypothetical protein
MRSCKAIIFIILLFAACKKPYNPPAITNVPHYLVVEGVINSGSDLTVIKLSRTVSLSNATAFNPVVNATVVVESDNNISYPLTQGNIGYYYSSGLNLDITRKYSLRITTTDNNEQYISDFVPVNITPPIDSVGFAIQNNGLQIYVNTHDPSNNTKYYRWDYDETWQFHSKYYSGFYSNGSSIVPRLPDQSVYSCFGYDTSSTIVLGSSARLKQDIIYQNPVTLIASTSEKIETKYSINVRQYALTGDAFAYWTNLKKNTEQLGSIFDAQPTNIIGNIHSITNPAEPVIGYISASSVQTKRIFISNSQLPISWSATYPYDCGQDSILLADVTARLVNLPPSEIPTGAITQGGLLVGYLGSSAVCVDCTLRGSTAQPLFWR